jgi:hypothetical protein
MDPTLIAVLTALLVLCWIGLIFYSRRKYPYLACRSCKGTGKDFEPMWLMWVCLRRERAWRKCLMCGGVARRERGK